MGQYLVRHVVRFVTFSALELTHTCCNHNDCFSTAFLSLGAVMIWLKDPTEIEEMREEEASMIDRLDLLVEEFMKEIDELPISLPDFLRTRWPERMYAELSEKDEMSEIEQRAMGMNGFGEKFMTMMNGFEVLRRASSEDLLGRAPFLHCRKNTKCRTCNTHTAV